jgi:hypothetical protein
MLIMIVCPLLLAPFHSGKHFVTRFRKQYVILDARACAAFGNVYSRLDRDHHAGFKLGGFSGKDAKSRIMIAEANVVTGVMSEEGR